MKKILIIDDEPNYCQVTKLRLEESGDNVVEICNESATALQHARTFNPDIALLDIMMPGMNGFEVALALKKHPDTKTIPIIFISGFLREELDIKNKNLTGDMIFVSKTEEFENILDAIENVTAPRGEEIKRTGKQTVRIVTYLPREHVDYLDKVGKDVLFSEGFKLSRSELLKQLVEFLQKLDLEVTELGLSNHDLSEALIERFKKK